MRTCISSWIFVLLATTVSLVATSGCFLSRGGGGGEAPQVRSARSLVSYRFSAATAPRCTGELRWVWTPLSVSGEGRSTEYSSPEAEFQHYDQPSSGNDCVFQGDTGGVGLAPGSWRITVLSPFGGIGTCDVQLRPGSNVANFAQGTAGCSTQ
jgi:hypothetical protein